MKPQFVPAITKKELYGSLGINLVMGYHKLPSWKMYWCNDADLSVPFIASAMTRNRFSQILSNLHVNDNIQRPKDNKDKLYKLRPLILALNTNYVKLYSASKHQSIDESMILFKGRRSIKQYNPMKPIKQGYNLWMRADTDGRKSKKWWHRIFFGLLDRTIANAAIAFEKSEKKGMNLLDFRRCVAQTLITLSRPARGRQPASASPSLLPKRRKTNYSVDDGIRLQNRGCH